ncbi:MAG TPA: HAMP domain-containing sensor histidine kinase [Labilithrix sp.]
MTVARPVRRVLRPSLRTNVVAMVLAMLLLPQLIVLGWSATERDIAGKLMASAKASANEAADVLAQAPPEEVADRLADVASTHTSRIRVVRPDGTERFDVDRDKATDIVHQIGTLFFGPDGAPTLREFDETLGPVPLRPEYLRTVHADAPRERAPLVEGTAHASFTSGAAPPPDPDVDIGCRHSPAGKLLVCHAARVAPGSTHDVIYVQESSRRAVRALYDLRYQLLRLSLLMLPLALVFSWWMGRRMVRPIESLRERVLEKARDANPHADLDPVATDEIDELAGAFNDLLKTLDEKRRANEEFVADLVHEFKNPVAAIRACGESLDAGSVDAQRAQRLAKILADSSTRLDGLVSQFLELARAEAGLPNEARADVDLAALARGVVSTFEPSTKFVVDADGDATVSGVEPRLDSLVRNLVDNAAAFAGEGGEVRVSVARRDGRVVLEVSDSGPGIARADLPRVFERFFTTRATGEAARGRRGKGTGLGLALVKAVAEAHGGDVSATSKPGAGATFRVVLPAAAR